MNEWDKAAQDRYDKWVLSPAGEHQRRYEFEITERSSGQAGAIRRDVIWSRHEEQARVRKLNRDMAATFRRDGYSDPDGYPDRDGIPF